jgi:hypothetical protein
VVDIIRAFSTPEKFKTILPLDKIVADRKVVENGVSRYHEIIEKGHEPGPIIVLKHPNEDLYAVLDGHHRFWAMKEKGVKSVTSVVVDNYSNLGFELTKKGVFQPSPLFTKHVRIPLKRLTEYMRTFMENPWALVKKE